MGTEVAMATILMLTIIPAALAAAFDSVGFGLLAAAGLVWAFAVAVCSMAPVVAGRNRSANETISQGLSLIATAITAIGLVAVLLS